MKYALFLLFFTFLTAQNVVIETDTNHDFSFWGSDHTAPIVEFISDSDFGLHKEKKTIQVIYEDGNYYVYSFSKLKKPEIEEKSKNKVKRKKRRFKNSFMHFSGYSRKVVPEKFLDSDFIPTPENLKEARLKEVSSSKMDKDLNKTLKKAIENTSFDRKARELSYLVNIIKDFKNKGKIIKK